MAPRPRKQRPQTSKLVPEQLPVLCSGGQPRCATEDPLFSLQERPAPTSLPVPLGQACISSVSLSFGTTRAPLLSRGHVCHLSPPSTVFPVFSQLAFRTALSVLPRRCPPAAKAVDAAWHHLTLSVYLLAVTTASFLASPHFWV